VHPAQGREFFSALRLLGVPAEFILFPREGHGILERAHRVDMFRRILAWYDRYLKAP
jgi:dipeptidyl aminopeptidase/acylaminoacyl peptidase